MNNNNSHSVRFPAGPGFRLRLKAFATWLRDTVPATLFVSSCVTILQLGTSSLDAFDAYTYTWVGNVVTDEPLAVATKHRVPVVEIDDESFDGAFSRRSPLRRDELVKILAEVYSTRPQLVVIDLDLAPAADGVFDKTDKTESDAAECLRNSIIDAAHHGVNTVILDPFPVTNRPLADRRAEWKAALERLERSKDCAGDGEPAGAAIGRIAFAHGDIPARFGMSNWFYKDANSMFAAAQQAVGSKAEPEHSWLKIARRRELIDPRRYLGQLDIISTSETGAAYANLSNRIYDSYTPENRVVYFGGAWGGDDLFATPLGRLYGVELHAAAFATCWPLTECTNRHEFARNLGVLVLDLVIGLVFGLVIGFFWKKYLALRTDPDPEIRAVAGVAVIKLVFVLGVAIFLSIVLAAQVLATWGLWLSPLPMAIGMYLDALTVGPVEHLVPHEPHAATAPATSAPQRRLPTLLGFEFSAKNLRQARRVVMVPVILIALVMSFVFN